MFDSPFNEQNVVESVSRNFIIYSYYLFIGKIAVLFIVMIISSYYFVCC